MEEEKKLYPLRLIPIEEGAESIQIADLGYQDTEIQNGFLSASTLGEVMDMYMDRVVGENVFSWYGRQFPISVKYINVEGRLPLMVCPDDEIAAQRFDFLGKRKLWYIVDAQPDARLQLGFSRDTESAEFYMAVRHGNLGDMLCEITPQKGDAFIIKPGTLHSASGHMTIAEVSECSPLDFRIFNWGEPLGGDDFDEQLGLDAAFDFIDYSRYKAVALPERPGPVRLAKVLSDGPEFKASEISLTDPIRIRGDKNDSFGFYTCLRGGAKVLATVDGLECSYPLGLRESVLIPSEVSEFTLVPEKEGTVLLEVMMEERKDKDSYAS